MKRYFAKPGEMRKRILQDAPDIVEKVYDSRNWKSELALRQEMIQRRTGVLVYEYDMEEWKLVLPNQRLRYVFKAETPTHYINMMHAIREEKGLRINLAKPKGKNKKKQPPL